MKELKSIWFDDMRTTGDFYFLNPALQGIIPSPNDSFGSIVSRILGDLVNLNRTYETLVAQPSIFNPDPLKKRCLDIESRWSPTGPGLRGAGISVTRDRLGHRIVFARGYDDTLYVRWQRDADPILNSSVLEATHWSRWHSFEEKISSDPVAFLIASPGQPDNPVRAGVIARFVDESRYQASTLDDFASVARIDRHAPTRHFPFLDMQSVPSPTGMLHYSSQPTVIQRGPDGRAWAFCHNALNKQLAESNT